MRAIVEKLAAGTALLGGATLLAIVLVTTANAGAFALDRVARLFGGTLPALPGYEDFVRMAISVAALMLLPWCQQRRGHVAVDLFSEWMPRRFRRALDVSISFAMAGMALFLAFWMTVGMLETRADGVLSRVLGWPEWPCYLPGIVSLLLWAVVAVLQGLPADGADGA